VLLNFVISRKRIICMMFADSYHNTFATVGVQLTGEDGCPSIDIENTERRLGIQIPVSLHEYYLLAGREKRINQFFDRLRFPEQWEIDSTHWDTDSDQVVFMEENQSVAFWGIPSATERKTDDAVAVGFNIRQKGVQWRAEHASCFTFLNVMILWHASFGGAAAHRAVGFVQEQATREALDAAWQFVGEVRSMRAYRRNGQAICFLKWQDPIQKMRKLPAWRVYAAAASEGEFEQIKAAFPAQWE
jgi:hypothetical protein